MQIYPIDKPFGDIDQEVYEHIRRAVDALAIEGVSYLSGSISQTLFTPEHSQGGIFKKGEISTLPESDECSTLYVTYHGVFYNKVAAVSFENHLLVSVWSGTFDKIRPIGDLWEIKEEALDRLFSHGIENGIRQALAEKGLSSTGGLAESVFGATPERPSHSE